jgi:hypothetical protein
MEHDQRVCPRCGEPAGGYGFCQSCRSHIDSLTGTPAHAGAHATDPSYLAAQVLRLEQALAATSKGISDRIAAGPPAAAVQVDADPRPGENSGGDASDGTLERAKLLTGADERVSGAPRAAREVARLEDVLTVASTDDLDRIAAKTVTPAVPNVEPAQNDADDTTHDVNAAPGDEVELPTSAEKRASAPTSVAAHVLREAFWFEQSAFWSNGDGNETTPPAPQAAAAGLDRDRDAADSTRSNAEPDPSDADARPCAQHDSSRSARSFWMGQTSGRHWAAALCLLALVGLVVVLTGRDPRRFIGKAS